MSSRSLLRFLPFVRPPQRQCCQHPVCLQLHQHPLLLCHSIHPSGWLLTLSRLNRAVPHHRQELQRSKPARWLLIQAQATPSHIVQGYKVYCNLQSLLLKSVKKCDFTEASAQMNKQIRVLARICLFIVWKWFQQGTATTTTVHSSQCSQFTSWTQFPLSSSLLLQSILNPESFDVRSMYAFSYHLREASY